MTVTEVDDDPGGVLAALDDLGAAVDANVEDERLLVRRIGELRAGRADGRTWYDLLAGGDRPGVLRVTARIVGRLMDASGALRRALARGLRAEGTKISSIADLFGVSHQRISALLRREDRPPAV